LASRTRSFLNFDNTSPPFYRHSERTNTTSAGFSLRAIVRCPPAQRLFFLQEKISVGTQRFFIMVNA
jgi:hypothetical protein